MNRTRWLIILVALFVVGNLAYYFWAHWGLVTVHAQNRPLAEIIRSIEKQGHATIKTDLDPAMLVQMNVDQVVLPEALETLSTITESRWRLAYFVAGDQPSIQAALSSIGAGQRPEGWKTSYVPLMPINMDEQAIPPDPRRDLWAAKAAPEPKLQAFLDQAAQSVSASFFVPVAWNPAVNAAPKAGPITKSLARLASVSGSKSAEVFLLQKNGRTAGRGGDDEGDGPRPGGFGGFGGGGGGGRPDGGGFNREAMQQRMQAEIDKLPPDKKLAAQKEMDERRAFFESLRDLPPEQRRAKMEEMFQNPAAQDRMESAQASRDARRTPQQRVERAQKYLERKMQAKNTAKP